MAKASKKKSVSKKSVKARAKKAVRRAVKSATKARRKAPKRAAKRRAPKANDHKSALALLVDYLNETGKNLSDEMMRHLTDVKDEMNRRFGGK